MDYFYNETFHELWAGRHYQFIRHKSLPINVMAQNGVQKLLYVNNADHLTTHTCILPDLSSHIVAHVYENAPARLRLIGPRTRGFFINRRQRSKTYIMRFYPRSFRMLTEMPTEELTNRSFDLTNFLEGHWKSRTLEALGNENMEQLFETLLVYFEEAAIRSTNKPAKTTKFMQLIHQASDQLTVHSCAQKLGISERYLHRISKEELGISPKNILKINRFTQSLRERRNNPFQESWTQIALQSGYYDQSHMIDEYQHFIGTTPASLF